MRDEVDKAADAFSNTLVHAPSKALFRIVQALRSYECSDEFQTLATSGAVQFTEYLRSSRKEGEESALQLLHAEFKKSVEPKVVRIDTTSDKPAS